jgi:hypothetical protein
MKIVIGSTPLLRRHSRNAAERYGPITASSISVQRSAKIKATFMAFGAPRLPAIDAKPLAEAIPAFRLAQVW